MSEESKVAAGPGVVFAAGKEVAKPHSANIPSRDNYREKIIQELSEVVQSSNINFLFGAGISSPLLPLLNEIEKNLNMAKSSAEKEVHYKEYLKVILPNKEVLKGSLKEDKVFCSVSEAYKNFLRALAEILLKRKSTILSKQVNLFTTNIDILLEHFLEKLKLEYNDGFAGKFKPIFGLANFKKAIYQRSLHFDHKSEVPLFNVIKIHGSLSWKYGSNKSEIVFSNRLGHIDDDLLNKTGAEFVRHYKKILIVNPEVTKHLESVLNLYYSELLRLYSNELEKENTLLFVVGFSMEDSHIREITLRAAKSNPTLRIIICCSESSHKAMAKKMQTDQHPNIQVLSPKMLGDDKEAQKFSLDFFQKQVLNKIIFKRASE